MAHPLGQPPPTVFISCKYQWQKSRMQGLAWIHPDPPKSDTPYPLFYLLAWALRSQLDMETSPRA